MITFARIYHQRRRQRHFCKPLKLVDNRLFVCIRRRRRVICVFCKPWSLVNVLKLNNFLFEKMILFVKSLNLSNLLMFLSFEVFNAFEVINRDRNLTERNVIIMKNLIFWFGVFLINFFGNCNRIEQLDYFLIQVFNDFSVLLSFVFYELDVVDVRLLLNFHLLRNLNTDFCLLLLVHLPLHLVSCFELSYPWLLKFLFSQLFFFILPHFFIHTPNYLVFYLREVTFHFGLRTCNQRKCLN